MFSSSCFPLTRVVLVVFLSLCIFFLSRTISRVLAWKETVFLFSPGIRRGYSTLGCIWMMAELLSPQLFSSPRSSSAKASYSHNFLLPCNIFTEVIKAPEGIFQADVCIFKVIICNLNISGNRFFELSRKILAAGSGECTCRIKSD